MWWKNLLIFLTILTISYCDSANNNYSLNVYKKKPYKGHFYYHLLYGGILYYLVFIALKVKIAIVLGTILTLIMVAGKFFALIKFAEFSKTSVPKPEKIYIQPGFNHGPPKQAFSSHFSDISVDKLPPNAQIAGGPYSYPPEQQFSMDRPFSHSPYSDQFSVDKLPPNAEIAGPYSYPSPYSGHFNDVTVDKLPPNAVVASGGPYYDSLPPQHY
ncbi:uncharacterized protein LOC103313590 [Tribolium castaneum]|uniref:uncharacterized protein LOC103313590 n=1 Tax=Tribolium castaneum TaxID=7070 RepID=UPI00046BFBC7|nr:PREDICTED: uncharacterized protein LOC103313590 [Tribolium castaneum]|eukprot:XP_015836846.1 PREDICTED: uncharacterized protein LOC103313590 [Tribolium castaneum]